MKKFAVLIDADNSSHRNIEPILEEIAKYGIASVKRIYGDWSADSLQTWRDKLLPNAITPVQQFAYVTQKDATDMRLVIDAMDLLFAGDLDGFCIVSSDSDFTPLVSRIRESGLLVYGFGEKKTVPSFVNSCDKFIYVENLNPQPINSPIVINASASVPNQLEAKFAYPDKKNDETTTLVHQSNLASIEIDPSILNLIYRAIKENADDEGWANLSAVGSYINNVKPDFDPRSYGRSKLSSLLKKLVKFETKLIDSRMLVRKFDFNLFIEVVKQTIETILEGLELREGWVEVSDLIQQLAEDSNYHQILANLSEHEIEQKVQAIYSSIIEFSDDKSLIRIAP